MLDHLQCCPKARVLGRVLVIALAALIVAFSAGALVADDKEKAGAIEKPQNAVVLFDGKDFAKWQGAGGGEVKWKIVDGAMEVAGGGGDIITKEKIPGSYLLHVEFMPPNMPDASGQGKGNSGVYVANSYEVQVLDSHGLEKLGEGDCAAIYSKKAPDKNASKPPAEWQSYDIVFKAPKFDADGKKTHNATITIYWNGEKVHDNFELDGPCPGGQAETREGGGIRLQDHGNPVRYRNIWYAPIREQ